MNQFKLSPGLNLWPIESCLFSELSFELENWSKEDLKDILIVVPTQRLGVYILESLASAHKAFIPPRIVNFETFIDDFSEEFLSLDSVVSDLSSELMLGSLLKSKGYKHLIVGDEHELLQFFKEILEADLKEQAFTRMREVIAEDIYRSENHLQFMSERTAELEDLFKSFSKILAENNLCLKADATKKLSNYLCQKLESYNTFPKKWVYFVGFTTLSNDYVRILQKVVTMKNVSVWFSRAPELCNDTNPLKLLIHKISVVYRPRDDKKSFNIQGKKTNLHQLGSPLAEVVEAANRVKDYIKKGVCPAKIGVLLTCEKTYSNLVRSVFSRSDILCNIASSLRISQTLLGTFINSFIALTQKNQDKNSLLSFLLNPITFRVLQEVHGEEPLNREKLTYALLQGQEKNNFLNFIQGLDDLVIRKTLFDFYQRHERIFTQFFHHRSEGSLLFWTYQVQSLLKAFKLEDTLDGEESDLSVALSAATKHFMASLLSVGHFFDPAMTLNQFWELVQKKILSLEIRGVGYPLEGVQILRLIESRYVPFDVVVILGCNEGKFPKQLPKDYILDDWFKRRLGLPGWAYVEALEDTTFSLLKARIPNIDLFYTASEESRSFIPSRFLEIEKAQNKIIPKVYNNNWHGFFAQENTLKPESIVSNHRLDAKSLLSSLSAKSSSYLVNCPFRFMLYHLKLDEVKLFKEDLALEEGQILHKILELFFKGYKSNDLSLEKIPSRISFATLDKELFNRIKILTDHFFHKALSQSLYYHLLSHSWPKFLSFVKQFYYKEGSEAVLSVKKFYKELNFGGEFADVKTPYLQMKKSRLPLKGSIDSLDVFQGGYLLMDYKRKFVPTQKQQKTLEDSQLLFYAMIYRKIFGEESFANGLTGYWSILEGNWYPRSVGSSYLLQDKIPGLKIPNKESLEKNTEFFESLLLERLDSFDKEDFPFVKKPGKNCERCDYKDLCLPDKEVLTEVSHEA